MKGRGRKNTYYFKKTYTKSKKVFSHLTMADNKSENINYSPPDFNVLEKDKTADWYKQAARYFANFYNRPFAKYYDTAADVGNNLTPVDEIINNFRYYQGQQQNKSFAYLGGDWSSQQANWRNGNKVYSLVNSMDGSISKVIQNVKPTVEAISKRARNKKNRTIEDLSMKVDASAMFDELKQLGVNFTPVNESVQINDKEDIDNYMNYTYQDFAGQVGVDVADRLINEQYWRQKGRQGAKECAIGGITGWHNYIKNGRLLSEVIPPWAIIWDNTKQDDFNRDARFRGFIKSYTPAEIELRWKSQLSESDIKEIRNLAKTGQEEMIFTNNFINLYDNQSMWFGLLSDGSNRVGKISAVTMYFVVNRDTRYKKKDVMYKGRAEGVENIITKKLDDTNEAQKGIKGDYLVSDICQCTLIANKYIVDYGYVNNSVRNPHNPSDPEYPLRFYIPNMTLDSYRSVVSRLGGLQDETDAYGLKIRELMGRDLGKVYLFNGAKIGIAGTKVILEDIKSTGFHVTKPSGEHDNPTDRERMVEQVDMTLDPNVMRYFEMKNLIETEMEAIASIPKIALGQQTAVIGKGVQQGTIQQSSLGTASFYTGYITYLQECLMDGVNRQCIAFCAEGNEDLAEEWIGERGLQFVKAADGMILEPLGVYLQLNDVLDEPARQRLLALAQAWSQNPEFGLKPLDIVKMEKSTNYSEMIQILESSLKRHDMNTQQMEAYKQQIEAVSAEKEKQLQDVIGQQNTQISQMQEEMTMQRDKINNESKEKMNTETNQTKIIVEEMKGGVKDKQNTENNQAKVIVEDMKINAKVNENSLFPTNV